MIKYVLEDFSQLIAGTTTKKNGNFSRNSLLEYKQSCEKLSQYHHINSFFVSRNIHSNIIFNINTDDLSLPHDALITNQKNVLIGVTTADCIPIFLYEPHKQVIGIVHSGRIGLRDHITEKTLLKMKQDFCIDISKIIIQIGPHICASCYEVGSDIINEFDNAYNFSTTHLDMQKILVNNLLALGVTYDYIRYSKYCTCCYRDQESDDFVFFSYRQNQEQRRLLSFIGMYS